MNNKTKSSKNLALRAKRSLPTSLKKEAGLLTTAARSAKIEINQKTEQLSAGLRQAAKTLIREEQLKELDRIAKLLVRRDLELTEIREAREKEFDELKRKTKELEDFKKALLNILEDIEESRALTEEEKNKTLALISNFSDGVLFFNNENKLSLINVKAEGFFVVKSNEVIGRSLAELNRLENIKPLIALIGPDLKETSRQELILKEELILEETIVPVLFEEKKLGALVILHDITREKSIERMKTEFVSIAAHQLRTPLSAVKWILSMFLSGDVGEISFEQKELLERTYQSNERMIHLVNDLLNTTRIEEGKFLAKMAQEDMKDLVEKIVAPFREEIKKKGLGFECQLPKGRLPRVAVDAEKLSLAVQNLMDNALNYTKRGGVKIVLSFNKNENNFLFSVSDTGAGISEKEQSRVFSKFFRSAAAVRAEPEGSGLGLFIAKNIIEAHGGRIWFESEEGRGTTFYFTLPIVKEEFAEFLKEF